MEALIRAPRRDGAATRDRILNAACRIFAEKGLKAATTADICKLAECNIAAVNYHFGNKNSLYVAAWAQAFQDSLSLFPVDGSVAPDRPVEERFKGHIKALIKRMTDRGRLGHFHRMYMAESMHPSGLIDKTFHDLRRSNRAHMHALLTELLRSAATEESIVLCETSILGQCQAACQAVVGNSNDIATEVHESLARMRLGTIVEHIVRFSLAGIEKIRTEAARRSVGGARRQRRRSSGPAQMSQPRGLWDGAEGRST